MNNSHNKTRILIVEDERLPAEDLSLRLQKNDFKVVGIAGTGAQAVKLAKDTEPDIILMDIKLRGKMNGIEAAKNIHSNLAAPIIFTTAYGDENHIAQAMEDADAYGFLHKPIEDQAIQTMIKIALTRFATDQMMLRINELLSLKDSIYSGLDSTNSVAEIGELLHNTFSSSNIFKNFWIVLWSAEDKIAAAQSSGLPEDIFQKYLKKRDRKSLENQKMMIPDELMSSLLHEESYQILIRGEKQIVGLVGFTWNLKIPNFRNELTVIKDVAHLISQSIKNIQLKDVHEKNQRQMTDSEAHIKAIVEQSATGIFTCRSQFQVRLCQ